MGWKRDTKIWYDIFVRKDDYARYNRAYKLRVGSDFVGVKLNIILVSVPLKGTIKTGQLL